MDIDKQVLIVGAGPSGLMMACQLAKYGVSFKIIDKQPDRTQESRAFGIQAKSMEIFQNLGLVEKFLEKAQRARLVNFYLQGQLKLQLNFDQIKIENTPFSSIYFLPQSETEKILIAFLMQKNIVVDRQIALENFQEFPEYFIASLKHQQSGNSEKFKCRYIIGCDGAHSRVREQLGIRFLGGDYQQDFFLADVKMKWPTPSDQGFKLFFDPEGIFLNAPLDSVSSRIIGAKISSDSGIKFSINIKEIEDFAKKATHFDLKIEEALWMSRFRLHHRIVKHYQKGNAFLVGDAAHIHSPVGAQGMNTGLQDASNLAWKIALTIKNDLDYSLLSTYELEREFIGSKLTKTTDRLFWLLTSPNYFLNIIRPIFLVAALKIISHFPLIQKRIFWLMSQLGIRYNNNLFVYEKSDNASADFLAGPYSGSRAPDAPLENTSLFERLRESPANILIFITSTEQDSITEEKIQALRLQHQGWLGIHQFFVSLNNAVLFKRYGVTQNSVYFIRPDGYIGFRQSPLNADDLFDYLNKYLKHGIPL